MKSEPACSFRSEPTEDGTKELLAVVEGYRESTQSWRELLQQLKRQGLSTALKLAVGDRSLGFWIALQGEYCPVAQQRCWVHKTANILDKMPKSVQGKAKQLIHESTWRRPAKRLRQPSVHLQL
jgi:putative transposase